MDKQTLTAIGLLLVAQKCKTMADIDAYLNETPKNQKAAASAMLLSNLLSRTNEFEQPLAVLKRATERPDGRTGDLSLSRYMDMVTQEFDQATMEDLIFAMHLEHSTPDMAQVSAQFLAEFYAKSVREQGTEFKSGIGRFVENPDRANTKPHQTLSDIFGFQARKESALTVQHALVDLVANAPADMPLQRGEKQLPLLAELARPDVAKLWQQKAMDIRPVRREGLGQVSSVVVKPVFPRP